MSVLMVRNQNGEFEAIPSLRGEKGDSGYTPVKGVDYFDGTTPVKGVDYFDGHSPVITTARDGNSTRIYSDGQEIGFVSDGAKGATGDRGPQGYQGNPGQKGDPGIQGPKGDTGNSGVFVQASEPTDSAAKLWIDTDGESDTIVTDVKVAGTSIVTDGVAVVPIATPSTSTVGALYASPFSGIAQWGNGIHFVRKSEQDAIDIRKGIGDHRHSGCIDPSNLDYAVRSAITAPIGTAGVVDGVYQYPSYTDEEMARARERIGIEYRKVAEVTVTESEVNRVVVSNDLDGNAFSLSHIICYLVMDTPATSSYGMRVRDQYNTVLSYETFCFATNLKRHFTKIDLLGDFFIYAEYACGANANDFANGREDYHSTRIPSESGRVSFVPITELRFEVDSGKVIPVGTKLYIYGA